MVNVKKLHSGSSHAMLYAGTFQTEAILSIFEFSWERTCRTTNEFCLINKITAYSQPVHVRSARIMTALSAEPSQLCACMTHARVCLFSIELHVLHLNMVLVGWYCSLQNQLHVVRVGGKHLAISLYKLKASVT